ncbi:Hypp7496 [Branchiostoma lanceolatum]|uniref:Hypp7496 protein n=1 Tax=Branchiostoma lanceolatum TaxID=7740 RepID=A0A8J9Z1M8_BRALA|nr:Hypp7496 [Branchiostoma lanceolatum]
MREGEKEVRKERREGEKEEGKKRGKDGVKGGDHGKAERMEWGGKEGDEEGREEEGSGTGRRGPGREREPGPDGRKRRILSRSGRKTAAGLVSECARAVWDFVGRNFGARYGVVSAGGGGFRQRDHRRGLRSAGRRAGPRQGEPRPSRWTYTAI